MTCTQDRIENRHFRDLDLESSTTAELQKYYNEVYKKGLHKYEYGVKQKPKRTQSDGHLKLITDAYKTHVLSGERVLSKALESHSQRTAAKLDSAHSSTKATSLRQDLSSANTTMLAFKSELSQRMNGMSRQGSWKVENKCATVGTKIGWSRGQKPLLVKNIKISYANGKKDENDMGKRTVNPVMLNSMSI